MVVCYLQSQKKEEKQKEVNFFYSLFQREKERSEADERGRRSFLIVGRGKIGKMCLRDCNGYNHDFPATEEGGEILLLTTV